MILVGVVLSDTDCAGLRTLFDSSGLFFDFLSRLALKQQRLTQRVLLPRFKIKGGTCRLVQIIFYQKTKVDKPPYSAIFCIFCEEPTPIRDSPHHTPLYYSMKRAMPRCS